MMAQKTGEILNFRVVQITEATSSVAMEKEGFKRRVDDLIASGFQFTSLALIVIQKSPYYVAQSIITSTIKLMSGMYPKAS